MLKTIDYFLEDTGWKYSRSFWIDCILLGCSLPFFIFPNRFPLHSAILLVTWLIRWFIEFAKGPQKLKSPFTFLILLFAAWCIVPILITVDPQLTLDKALGLLLGFITWRFVTTYVRSESAFQLLVILTTVLGTAFVGVGFLAVDWLEKIPAISAIVNLFPQQVISLSAIGSGQGVQPNQLAGTILWLYPFTASLSIWFWKRQQTFLAGSSFTITLIFISILVLSQSRGGWLGGLTALGIGTWLATFGISQENRFRSGRWLLPLIIISTAITSVLIFGTDNLLNLWIDPPDSTLVGNLGTLSFRQEVWLWSIQAIQDFPFTGTGLGTFRLVVHRLYPIAIPSTFDIAHAHNVFLQVALDVGLIGLIIYLAILGVYFYHGSLMLMPSSSEHWLAVSLLASMAGFHFYGLVDTVALGAKPALIFWLLISLMDRLAFLNRAEM